MERKAFLDQEPPPGYVAGIGRGATGFVTSADSGALRESRPFELLDDSDNDDNDDIGVLGTRILKEEEEADRVYEEIENRLQRRRKGASDETPQPEQKQYEDEIKNQFTDLKRSLADVSKDQWANLPDAPDLARRNKRMRLLEQLRQRFYATPDTMIAAQSSGGDTSFNTVDANGAELESNVENGIDIDNSMADLERNRTILSSLRKTEPNKPSSWIASARLELQAKNYNAAKKHITTGCRKVPHSESLWLENVKIHRNSTDGIKMAKIIVAEALKYNSRSEDLWLQACECENSSDLVSQRRVLMKGIEFIPNSVKLWSKMIEIQDDKDDVKKMLLKVVELCPNEWSFWLSLINLSDYSEAKSLINKARKLMKSNPQIWITAAKLEERENKDISDKKLIKMIEKGQQQLNESIGSEETLSRKDWLDEAVKAENEGFTLTCKAIVVNSINIDSPEEEESETKLSIYFEEAKSYLDKGANQTANFIYQYIIDKYPNDRGNWVKFFNAFKQQQGFNVLDLYPYYQQAISLNQNEGLFYLMYAKDKWKLENDLAGARKILNDALDQLPKSENVWHARIKFEIKTQNFQDADKFSKRMIENVPDSSSRVWYKHINLQRFIYYKSKPEDYETNMMSLLDDAMDRFPDEEKFYLQKGQILLDDLKKPEEAREAFMVGTNRLPNSINLWLALATVDEHHLKVVIRARSILDRAVFKNPKSDALWVEKVRLEIRNNDLVAARQICNRALKALNSSPYLWLEHLKLIPKMSQRKNAFLDALKSTDNSPIILLNIGIFFLIDGKPDKAKSWFERAISNDKTNGDIWAWMNYFFMEHNKDSNEISKFNEFFSQEEESINRGEVWNKVSKEVKNLDKLPKEILQLVTAELKDLII